MPAQAQPTPAMPSADPMADIFGGGMPAQSQPAMPALTSMFADANLSIDMSITRGAAPGEYNFKAYFSNSQMLPLSQVALQVAVQKYMKMNLAGITSQEIQPNSKHQVTQDMNIVNTQEG